MLLQQQQQTGIESISFMNNGISEQAVKANLDLLASQSPSRSSTWT